MGLGLVVLEVVALAALVALEIMLVAVLVVLLVVALLTFPMVVEVVAQMALGVTLW